MENGLLVGAPSKSELIEWIGAWIGRELNVEGERLDLGATFVQYGMDSVHAMMLVGDLEERLGRRLAPTLAWDHPSIDALAGYLSEAMVATRPAGADADAEILARLDDLSEEEIDALLEQRLAVSEPR